MATWLSNGGDTGGPNDSGSYNPSNQTVQWIYNQYAANGDTINIPSGTFTWNTGVTLSTKSVTIQGSGYTANTSTGSITNGVPSSSPGAPATLGSTVNFPKTGTGFAIYSTGLPTTGSVTRVTGIHFTGLQNVSNNVNYVNIAAGPTTDQWRLDNCFFDGGSLQVVMITVWGFGSGVIDHCTLIGGGASEMIHFVGQGAQAPSGSPSSWTNDVTPGSAAMSFAEDNIFQLSGYATAIGQLGTSASQANYGARQVLRYNLYNFCQYDAHGNVDVNTRWTEVYCNAIFIPSSNTGNSFFGQPRGGSGVGYNYSLASGCSTAHPIIISHYTDESSSNNTSPVIGGPQPAYGPGAGIFSASTTSQGPSSSPIYYWNIDTANSSSPNITLNHVTGAGGWDPLLLGTNYINKGYTGSPTTYPTGLTISEKASQIGGATYNYAPYTYPHPLTGLSTSPGNGITAAADSAIAKYTVGQTSGAYVPPTNLYLACFSTQFTNGSKAGAVEWTVAGDASYARTVMGTSPTASWTIAAYASGTGVVFENTNGVGCPAVQTNTQTLYSLGFCSSSTVGTVDIQLFIDLANNSPLTIDIGYYVYLPPLTGAVFTVY